MRSNRWLGPVILVVLMIAFGLLTVILPGIRDSLFAGGGDSSGAAPPVAEAPAESAEFEKVTIDVDGYLLGDELVKIPALGDYNRQPEEARQIGSLQLIGILSAIVVGSLAVFTIPIAAIVVLGNRSVSNMQASENYQEAANNLETSRKNYVKERKSEQPPTDIPDHERATWSVWSTGMVAVILSYFAGYVLGEGINPGSGGPMATIFTIFAIAISFLLLRPKKMVDVEETSDKSPNWSLIWVLLSGGVMMGLGVGLMFVVMGGGDPFPFIIWEPEFAIDWTFFQELIEPLTEWS